MFQAIKFPRLADVGREVVEVFKTNVLHQRDADILITRLNLEFGYEANFDLDDCDRILRVKAFQMVIDSLVIELLATAGFFAEVLPDVIPEII
jgi:hypothetical protein